MGRKVPARLKDIEKEETPNLFCFDLHKVESPASSVTLNRTAEDAD
jgi:hypothetical protein